MNMEVKHHIGDPCRDCQLLGLTRKLRIFHISLDEQIVKCESDTCMYPYVADDCDTDLDSCDPTLTTAAWLDEILGETKDFTLPLDLPSSTSIVKNSPVEKVIIQSVTTIPTSYDIAQNKITQMPQITNKESELKKPISASEKSASNINRSKLIIPKANLSRVKESQVNPKTWRSAKSTKPTFTQSSLPNVESLNCRSPIARVLNALKHK